MKAVKKHIVIMLAVLMLACLPAYAFGGEARSSGDSDPGAAQAQTSEAAIKLVDDTFAAMKDEAKKDEARIKEVTPEILNFGNAEG